MRDSLGVPIDGENMKARPHLTLLEEAVRLNVRARWLEVGAVVLIVGLALCFRLYRCDVMPRWNSDEGRWALGAVNLIRYHDWLRGGWYYGFVSPLLTSLIYLDFRLLGPSVVNARYISVVLGAATVGLVYIICRRSGYGRRVAWMAAVFMAFDGAFSVHNREAMTDTTLAFFVAAAFASYLWGPRTRLLTPLALAAAILTKATGIFGAGVLYAYGVVQARGKRLGFLKTYLVPACLPAAGVAIAAGCFAVLYLAHPAEFRSAWSTELVLRGSRSAVFYNPFVTDGLLDALRKLAMRMPLLLVLPSWGRG